jgi:hypothetical protein
MNMGWNGSVAANFIVTERAAQMYLVNLIAGRAMA